MRSAHADDMRNMKDEYDYRVRLIALAQCRCNDAALPDERTEDDHLENAAA